ncbi:MAG: hypothetical protein AAB839_02590 [Patescibacteria group bacterium]
MYFIVAFLIFLAILFGILGHQKHNHEFVYLSYIFALAAFGSGAVLFFALSAL